MALYPTVLLMQVEDYYELSRRLHPLGRPGTVLEVRGQQSRHRLHQGYLSIMMNVVLQVAHAIAFLAFDSASFITGSVE